MPHAKKRSEGKGYDRTRRAYQQDRLRIPKQVAAQNTASTKKSVLPAISGIGLALIVIVGFVLIGIIGHGSRTSTTLASGGTATVATGYGSLNHAKGPCGSTGQAACPAVQPHWFSVTSTSPTAVAAAITGSSDFHSMQTQYGYTSLDIPALVHAYSAHTGIEYYDDDHWVVSVRNAAGMRCGLFDFVYDRTHQRMRFSSYGVITLLDPHASQAFPYTSSSQATAILQGTRRLGVKSGTQPELIFFPIDPSFPILTSPVHNWAGGGNSPMNPMWYVVGSDAHNYFIGTDLTAHAQSELPIARGQP